ncbi:hypothetical protein KHA80_10390 [Anaerobacillus sp. HL2]|nr:hypothetical protein KHA80_10390 [Anaerobacillus sp. HL2]
MKKVLGIFVLVLLLITACIPQREKQEYDRYSAHFIDTFDTVIQVIGFASSEAEFTGYVEDIHERYEELHKLFDKYNEYEGINNIRTINNNAGIQPVKVNQANYRFYSFL